MEGMPDLNQRVTLRMSSGAEYDSRVEGVHAAGLSLARPLDLSTADEAAPGERLLVCWLVPRGVQVLPCAMASGRRDGRVALWEVEVAGEPWREQRRAYVRAAVPGTARIGWLGARRRHEVATALVDLSEGGLRCRTPDQAAARLDGGTVVDVELEAAGRRFTLSAQVVRVDPPSAATGDRWECVLVFVDAGRTADELRRLVFEQQVRERNGR